MAKRILLVMDHGAAPDPGRLQGFLKERFGHEVDWERCRLDAQAKVDANDYDMIVLHPRLLNNAQDRNGDYYKGARFIKHCLESQKNLGARIYYFSQGLQSRGTPLEEFSPFFGVDRVRVLLRRENELDMAAQINACLAERKAFGSREEEWTLPGGRGRLVFTADFDASVGKVTGVTEVHYQNGPGRSAQLLTTNPKLRLYLYAATCMAGGKRSSSPREVRARMQQLEDSAELRSERHIDVDRGRLNAELRKSGVRAYLHKEYGGPWEWRGSRKAAAKKRPRREGQRRSNAKGLGLPGGEGHRRIRARNGPRRGRRGGGPHR